ncbi:hypothetical protein DFH28DRAFT_1142820 [Melampsora americana]|nr:hypothetical protein DFH28DRAFT_1142820 [Melampsora americana]
MPRSKASKGQLRRQAEARIAKNLLQTQCLPIHDSNQSPALQQGLHKEIDLSDEDKIHFLHQTNDLQAQAPPILESSQSSNPLVEKGLDKELESYQEDEIEFINQSNDVVLYIENHTADSSDEEKCKDNIIETLWPVFHTRWAPEPVLGKRTAPNGQNLKGYKRPALNPDTTSKKLIQNPVPRSTKSDYDVKLGHFFKNSAELVNVPQNHITRSHPAR